MSTERLIVAFGIGAALLSMTVPVVGQERREAEIRLSPPGHGRQQRLADGQPNVQGIWAAVSAGSMSLTNPISVAAGFRSAGYRRQGAAPAGLSILPTACFLISRGRPRGSNSRPSDYDYPTKPEHIDPQHRCLVSGMPRLYTIVPAFKIIQPPGSIVFIWDEYHAYRVIPLDGRPHVGPNVKLWMGDARGHWEGNTLVIDTTNVRGARLTYTGDFYTDNAHIVERLTFVDANTMNYEATVDDPTVFTRPWTMRVAQRRRPDDEMWETACYEGNMPPDTWLLNPDTKRK